MRLPNLASTADHAYLVPIAIGMTVHEECDFNKSRSSPYAAQPKKKVTIC
jgi:hypothetical protein